MNSSNDKTADTVSALPLRSMDYSGGIDGAAASITLALKYTNKLDRPIEPLFTFPLPAEASVLGVTVKVGERIIQSELKKAADARSDYEQAVSAGHQATMLEQHRDNIFTMSVGGIAPGEDIEVQVRYMHHVEWQNGGGRFILPLVVAPHFIHGSPQERSQRAGFSPDTDEVPDASAITPRVAADPNEITYRASVNLRLAAGFDATVSSPSHGVLIPERSVPAADAVHIALDDLRPDRDLTITYRGADRAPQIKVDHSEWQPSPGGEREVFTIAQIMPTESAVERPRRVVLCLDCSGSMEGQAIAGLRAVVARCIEIWKGSAQPVELAIIKFADSPEILLPLQRIGPDLNSEKIISQLKASGGTRAARALDESLRLQAREHSLGDLEKSIVFLTDGDTSDIRYQSSLSNDVRIHAVGLSTAVDHAVLKAIARESGGSTYWVYPGEDCDTAAREIAARTFGPVARNLRLENLPVGAEVVGLRDVYGDRPTMIGIRSTAPLNDVVLRAEGSRGVPLQFDIATGVSPSELRHGHSLWARMKMNEVRDDEALAAVSLRYGVLSRATSFVAVLVRERPGQRPERIEIPVSLPHGWEMESGWSRSVGAIGIAGASPLSSSSRFLRARSHQGHQGSVSRLFSACKVGGEDVRSLFAEPSSEFLERLIDSPPVPKLEPTLLREVREFFSQVRNGVLDSTGGSTTWGEISNALKAEGVRGFAGWLESDRALLYKLITELRGFGFSVELPSELRAKPHDGTAIQLWREAERNIGVERTI